jgi:hypothetical protein
MRNNDEAIGFMRLGSIRRALARVAFVVAASGGYSTLAADNPSAADSPSLEWVMTVKAAIEPAVEMGKTPEGQRRVIPIASGTFEGPGMKGIVMPGGEDWQLVREDGTMFLDARYWLRTDDGAIIRVNNAVTISAQAASGQKPAARYSRSAVKFEAPIGKYDWLNKAVFVGTIKADTTQRPAVVTLQFYKVN